MSTKDFRTRNEIVVTIPDGSTAKVEQQSKKKKGAAIPPGKAPKRFLKRRTKNAGINFYDLGFIRTGDGPFLTPEMSVVPSVTLDVSFSGVRDLNADDYAARDSIVLAVPRADWKSRYKRISKGDISAAYGLVVSIGGGPNDPIDALEDWKATGLVIDQAELDSGVYVGSNGQYFDFFPISGPDLVNYKITGTNDFDGPPVSYTPGLEMTVYFMPSYVLSSGRSIAAAGIGTPPGGGSAEIFKFSYLNYLYAIFPRAFRLDPLNPNFTRPTSGLWLGDAGGDAIDYAAAWNATLMQMAFAFGRSWTQTALGSAVGWTSGGFPAGPFVAPPGYPPVSLNPRATLLEGNVTNQAIPGPGVLIAIVQKGSNYYYFWTV